jgi:O-antigen/teichoic acid export membrane protein
MIRRLELFAAQYPSLAKWIGLVGVTTGGQIAIQGIGFIAGILTIRLLDTDQYAYYTLVNTMLGTMTVLADGGISTGVLSEGGKVWQDKEELGKVLATGMDLRKKFAIGSMAVSMPFLYYLLREQSVPVYWVLLLILSLLPTFYATLSGGLLKIVPRLHQEVSKSIKIDLRANLWRLVFTAGSLMFFPFAICAVLASGAGQLRANHLLRKLSAKHMSTTVAPNPVYRKKIMRVVWRVLPGSIYYCVSGQITIWLISIFGSTSGIAQIGALGRLMVLLMLVQNSLDLLIVPRFARMMEQKKYVLFRFYQVLGGVTLVSLAIIIIVYYIPTPILYILGKEYADLEDEMLLMTISSCITLVAGVINRLASSRGIIPHPGYFLSVTIFFQLLILLFCVDYTTVSGVLMFGVIAAAMGLVYRIVHFSLYN